MVVPNHDGLPDCRCGPGRRVEDRNKMEVRRDPVGGCGGDCVSSNLLAVSDVSLAHTG
jgi:hypothetical protein